MKNKIPVLTIMMLVFLPVSLYAQTFIQCVDKSGKRYFTNLPEETLSQDCSTRDDYRTRLFMAEYERMANALHREDVLLQRQAFEESRDSELVKSGIQTVTDSIESIFDVDNALDMLHGRQQKNRDNIPFKTHLQTKGFDRLLELQ